MKNVFFFGVGGVLSADIAVPELERVRGFYIQVLTTGSAPLWQETLTNNQGMPIIGLGPRSAEYEALPIQWMPHIQASDIAASAERTAELGGQVLMQDRPDDGESQWAVLLDPFGAAFGVIPVVADDSIETGDVEKVGCIAGLSIEVSDVARARNFYEQVVGWKAASGATSGDRCKMLQADGQVVAEIDTRGADHSHIPSVWLLSLPVDDFNESLRQVVEGGGKIVRELAGSGYAVIRDPVGVYFALQDAT